MSLVTTKVKSCELKSELTIFQIGKKIWAWILAIFVTYVTEMSVFPAILSLVVSTGNSEWSTKYFIPLGCFLVFFVAKFLGTTLAKFTAWPRNTEISSWFVLSLALLRFGFIPLFLFCNIAPNQRNLSMVIKNTCWTALKCQFFNFFTFRCYLSQTQFI